MGKSECVWTKLNEYVQRETHPLPSVDLTLGKLAGAKYFTKLNANSGFWQIKLAKSSRPLTTFIHPGYGTVLTCCVMELALVLKCFKSA